jgi:hypothetical protein
VYQSEKTKLRPTLVSDAIFKFHINQTKELLVTRREIIISPSRSLTGLDFKETFKKNYLDKYNTCLSFLNEMELNTPQCKFDVEDILILRDMHLQMEKGELNEIREQIIKSNETRRGVSLMFFRNDKHLDGHEALERAVKKILQVEMFSDDRDFQYLYVLQCQSPKAVVLCENLHFLKMPGKPRENHIELWYAGGRNIEKLNYADRKDLPIYYSCDWDYDGLDIYRAVKEKVAGIMLLRPNGNPRDIKETDHKSLWKNRENPDKLSGLYHDLFSEQEQHLIKDLIRHNRWIVEESNDLIEMVNKSE